MARIKEPSLSSKGIATGLRPQTSSDEVRTMTRSLRTRLDLYKDPASNLKTLLYGTQPPEDTSPVEEFDVKLDHDLFAAVDKTLDDASTSLAYPVEALVGRQDAYIEQLEKENSVLKNGLDSLGSKIREVVTENQRLIQERRSHLLNSVLADATTPGGPKGLSDEEKMSHGIAVGSSRSHFERIQQLEVELGNARRELRVKIDEIEQLKSGSATDEHTRTIMQLKNDNEELVVIVRQLEELTNKMKAREEEAQQQIKRNISLIDQAQFEKVQALMDRDKAKEDLQNQQRRIEDLVKEYEIQAESERERMSKLHGTKLEEVERELANATNDLATIRSNLERADREKLDLRHQLQKAQNRLDHFHGDMQQMAEKLQEEITKALLERNIALQDFTQVKLNCEREKQEHQREMYWMKAELAENRKRLEEVERARMRAKSESVRLAERNLSLEKEVELARVLADRQKQGTKTQMDGILNRMRSKEEELLETMRHMERKYTEQHSELEQMIELQVALVDRFRNECRDLSNRMEAMLRSHQVSTDDLKRNNEILIRKLSSSSEKCKDLNNLCLEHNRRQVDMKQKLKQMEQEVYAQNEKIVHLLNRQNILLKERQFLHGEMAFLYEKFNSEVK